MAAPLVAPVRPPEPPSAPPLPFRYLGRMVKGDQVLVYLLKNNDMFAVEAGTTLERDYRIESVSATEVAFVYLPLGAKQILSVAAAE